MAFGVNGNGFSRPRLVDIQTQINDALKSLFGANIDLSAGSVFSQLSGVFAEREDLVWQAMEDVYNSQYPDTAFGASLDNVGAISGIPRLGALPSRALSVRLFGTAGTLVPAGTRFSVAGSPTTVFETDADVTLIAGSDAQQRVTFSAIPTAGQFKLNWNGQETDFLNWNDSLATIQAAFRALSPFAAGVVVSGSLSPSGLIFDFAGVSGKQQWPAMLVSANTLVSGGPAVTTAVTVLASGENQGEVNCTATEDGALVANAGTLTVIVTPVGGLNSVWNVLDAVVGRLEESDNEYRARRAETLQVAGAGTLEAIRAKLLQVTGVTAVIGFENITDIPDPEGRPPHSFEMVVQGGEDQTIADQIWVTKPAGIRSFGTETVQITDSQGQVHDIQFSRPTELPIYVEITVTINSQFPANGVAAVRQAIVDAGNALGIGREVIVIPYLISSIASIPGIEDAELLIGIAPNPTLSDNIPVAANQIAVFDSSRVDVVTV